jgi:hypothetical protein
MMTDDDQPICELEFVGRQSGHKVVARLWKPVYEASNNWWYCLSEVEGFADGKQKRTYGCDPFQAITMSMERFRTTFERHSDEDYRAGLSSSATIFPLYIKWADGEDIYRRLKKAVDDEQKKIENEIAIRFQSRRRGEGEDQEE